MTKLDLLKILKKVSNETEIRIFADCDTQGDSEFECTSVCGYSIINHDDKDERLILTAY